MALAGYLAEATGAPGEARERALEAARLAKADQVSVMVREFADLEGVMGETYALMEGHHPEVAQAIREQFLPDAAGGVVPETVPGALLATAEKVDNIVAAFACGEPPSGSKDPYGLRRAAAGMVAIAVEARPALRRGEAGGPGLRRAGEVPRTGRPRDRWCPKPPPSSWSGWPRRSPTTASARDTVDAVLPTSRDFLDLRARAEALQRLPRRRRLGRPGDGLHPAGQPGQEAARGRRGRSGRRGPGRRAALAVPGGGRAAS